MKRLELRTIGTVHAAESRPATQAGTGTPDAVRDALNEEAQDREQAER